MVQCLAAFMNCCYIVHRNVITTSDITRFRHHLTEFHQFQQIFIITGVWQDFSLPCQHALVHYPNAIELFGSPNGTCTSQTEVKHRPVVKQPWCRSSHNKPLPQMMRTITCLDKLAALWQGFREQGMLVGAVV